MFTSGAAVSASREPAQGLLDRSGNEILLPLCFEAKEVPILYLDCDDTLAETERRALTVCYDVLREAIGAWNIKKGTAVEFTESVDQFIAGHTGGAFRDMLKVKITNGNPFQEGIEDFVDRWADLEMERITEDFLRGNPPLELTSGTRELMSQLTNLGIVPYLVSSSADQRLTAILQSTRMTKYFPKNKIFSAQNVDFMAGGGRRKPYPDVYLQAVKAADVARLSGKQGIAVEDSPSGIAAGLRAGLDVVVFLGAYGKTPSIAEIDILWTEVREKIEKGRTDDEPPLGRIVGIVSDSRDILGIVEALRKGQQYEPVGYTARRISSL
jgi:beta-phosphoglucomutase-like phosphatase (HAD superfamily)